MFDLVRDAWSGDRLAARIRANQAELRERECESLLLAAAWADAYGIDTGAPGYEPLAERACSWGGEGTPEVSEYAVHELGALQGVSAGTAEGLIADALDVRHRLPRLWLRVRAGSVRAWQARAVAQATHSLSAAAAGLVDARVSSQLGMLPWGRCRRVLAAAVLDADPASAAARAERLQTERDVRCQDADDGLKLIVARAAAGDATWFMATVNRLAEILRTRGDADAVGVRRTKAMGLLARPAEALQLLIDHQHDTDIASQQPEPDAADDPDGPEPVNEHRSWDLTAPSARIDRAAVAPQVVLQLHLSDAATRAGQGVVRPEDGEPQTLQQFLDWLAETGSQVRVTPVVDPAAMAAVDGYETPDRLRDLLLVRHPGEVFPFGSSVARSMDLDHTNPYRPMEEGGPPGQTGLHNLGPLSRRNHRAVTHGRWRRCQPEPGVYVFRSPHGYVFLVTNRGTLDLGGTDYAQQVWTAALGHARAAPASAA